jgi:hypothetical protein
MARMFNTLAWIVAASTLAFTLACNGSPNSPTETTLPSANTEPADGATLKADAPTPLSPVDDVRLDNRSPTLVIANTAGRFVDQPFSYEFQLLSDSGDFIVGVIVSEEGGTTSWSYPGELERDTAYRWRARARLDDAAGPWTASVRFLTAQQRRAPNPEPGRWLPRPDWAAGIVEAAYSTRPDLVWRSCQEFGGTWEFMDYVVDQLRLEDSRFGYNCKRGNCDDPSKDIIAYNYGSDPDEGTANVYIIDIMTGHCGSNPSFSWSDVTGVTLASGTIGRWTSRGRF